MAADPIDDRRARLAQARADADALYNARLTSVDQALPPVVAAPAPPPVDQSGLEAVNTAWRILPEGAPLVDPADTSWRGRLRAFIWRLLGPPLTAQQHFNAALVDHLNRSAATERHLQAALTAAIDQLRVHAQSQRQFEEALIHLLQSVTAFVDTRDRHMGVLVQDDVSPQVTAVRQAVLALKRDLETRNAEGERTEHPAPASAEASAGKLSTLLRQGSGGQAQHQALSTALYVGFEDRFRGSQADIRARVTDYVALFAGATNVLDVGCGRGEVLELFREAGIPAKGIDLNPSMIEVCRDRGLEATMADAVGYLETQPDASVGGVLAIQVVEHLEAAYLSRFLELAFHKLTPGATMVLETINPTCWVAFFESYIRDMSHRWPLHPDTLEFLVAAHGFSQVGVQFRSPVSETGKLRRVSAPGGGAVDPAINDLIATVNAHADQLNARIFSHMDYAIVARR